MTEASPRAPDELEPRIGWRVWSVVEVNGSFHLASLVYHTIWTPGAPVVARCRRPLAQLPWGRMPLHGPPNFDCLCGVYGVATAELARPYLASRHEHAGRPVHRVIGRVLLWGRVVEGAAGWRAAYGYPEHVYVPKRARFSLGAPFRASDTRIAQALSVYRVPVEVVDV